MTPQESQDTAVLKSQMIDVKSALADLKTDQHANFTTLATKLDALSMLPVTIDDHEKRLSSIESALNAMKSGVWVRNSVFTIVGGVFVYLIQYALEHH